MRTLFGALFLRRGRSIRASVWILAGVFFTQTVLAVPPEPSSVETNVSPASLTLPKELGRIEKRYVGAPDKPCVVLIRDAHAVQEAQLHIEALIHFFERKWGTSVIAMEGGEGPLDTALFRSFPDKKSQRKVFQSYLEKGELTGAQLAAVFGERDNFYVGIEEAGLYETNLLAYREALGSFPEILKTLKDRRLLLDEKRKKVYSSEMDRFHEKTELFKAGKIDLIEFLNYLDSAAPELLENGKYPQLFKFEELVRSRKQLDLPALETEIRALAEVFRSGILSRERDQDRTRFNQERQSFETGSSGPSDFLAYLVRSAKRMKQPLSLSPDLRRFLSDSQGMESLRGDELFSELEELVSEIKTGLIRTSEEKEISETYARLDLLEKFSRLELERKDWLQYLRDPGPYKRLAEDVPLEKLENFYRLVERRDEVMYEKLEEILRGGAESSALLIAGGFHTEGLAERLSSSGYSFVIVSPKMRSPDGKENYENLMRGEISYAKELGTDLFDAFTFQTIRRLLDPLEPSVIPYLLDQWQKKLEEYFSSKGTLNETHRYYRYLDAAWEGYLLRSGAEDKDKNEWLADAESQWQIRKEKILGETRGKFEARTNRMRRELEDDFSPGLPLSSADVRQLFNSSGTPDPSSVLQPVLLAMISEAPLSGAMETFFAGAGALSLGAEQDRNVTSQDLDEMLRLLQVLIQGKPGSSEAKPRIKALTEKLLLKGKESTLDLLEERLRTDSILSFDPKVQRSLLNLVVKIAEENERDHRLVQKAQRVVQDFPESKYRDDAVRSLEPILKNVLRVELRKMLEIYQGAFDDLPGAVERMEQAERVFQDFSSGGMIALEVLEEEFRPTGLIHEFHLILGVRPLAGLILQIAINNTRSVELLKKASEIAQSIPSVKDIDEDTAKKHQQILSSLAMLVESAERSEGSSLGGEDKALRELISDLTGSAPGDGLYARLVLEARDPFAVWVRAEQFDSRPSLRGTALLEEIRAIGRVNEEDFARRLQIYFESLLALAATVQRPADLLGPRFQRRSFPGRFSGEKILGEPLDLLKAAFLARRAGSNNAAFFSNRYENNQTVSITRSPEADFLLHHLSLLNEVLRVPVRTSEAYILDAAFLKNMDQVEVKDFLRGKVESETGFGIAYETGTEDEKFAMDWFRAVPGLKLFAYGPRQALSQSKILNNGIRNPFLVLKTGTLFDFNEGAEGLEWKERGMETEPSLLSAEFRNPGEMMEFIQSVLEMDRLRRQLDDSGGNSFPFMNERAFQSLIGLMEEFVQLESVRAAIDRAA